MANEKHEWIVQYLCFHFILSLRTIKMVIRSLRLLRAIFC